MSYIFIYRRLYRVDTVAETPENVSVILPSGDENTDLRSTNAETELNHDLTLANLYTIVYYI